MSLERALRSTLKNAFVNVSLAAEQNILDQGSYDLPAGR